MARIHQQSPEGVLILVVMEYGLRLRHRSLPKAGFTSLNPCCNGIWSQTLSFLTALRTSMSLNPCCNGIWSQTRNSLSVSTNADQS